VEILKLSRINFALCILVLLAVSACSWVNPYIDRRRNAGEKRENLYVGFSQPDAPVICYNGWKTDFEQLQQMADAECRNQGTGIRAEFEEKQYFVCRLMTPAYAKFKCVK